MSLLDEVADLYEFGWNITRSALSSKEWYSEKTIFGDYIFKKDTDLRRSLEAEKLYDQYSKMLTRNKKVNYCRGALALIEEWDRIGVCPEELEIDEEDDQEHEEYEGYEVN